MATFKTNADHDGFNLGSDFPDFSLNGKGGFGGGTGEFGKDKTPNDSISSAIHFKGLASNGINGYGNTTNNHATLTTNNFDIDKIMQRNEERLQKLDRFGIPTVNDDRSSNNN
jgi:hypothetical protein